MSEILTVALPPECVQYKEDIRRFVDTMLYKLKIHAKKGKWEGYSAEEAYSKMCDEVTELAEAHKGGNSVEMQLEAADVANYAMIFASIVVERGK